MLRKMLTTLAVTVVGLLALSGVATAAPPYPPPPTVVVNVNITIVIVNNGTIIFFGDGFDPGEPINITISYNGGPSGLRGSHALTELAAAKAQSTTADSAGHFSTDVTLTEVGSAVLTATGVNSGKSASSTVTVLAVGSDLSSMVTTTVVAADGSTATYVAAAPGASGTGLASTGASIAGPIAIGLGALLAGLALLFFGTRGVIRRKGARGTPSP